ncbi:M14 family zinc carboxypeptidase [Aquirufa novilacunae]|uniref:M14 family zinc carboxypeptidase n=1 Tax=Aquirufa novilacunae TaxID=3139305 RepID=A0ABW8U373_9BACT
MFTKAFEHYESFRENRLNKRRFSASLWQELMTEWSSHFAVRELGKTEEGRPIHEVKWGEGPIQVIAWSQMHGDEATATMALADIFRLLSSSEGLATELKQKLHQKITLRIIPRLNADGAERWQRETALGIDMNRDATKQNSVEAQILSAWADEIKPSFAFNLHDQNRLYSVGNSPEQTHIAFLATTGDDEGTWTPSRLRAGQICNRMLTQIQPIIPGKIAKWTDEYESRAFGDTFSSRGYGLVLLESGGAGWDLEKHSLRKLNACLLIDAFCAIADESYTSESIANYEALPTNERAIVDIKITDAPLSSSVRADVLLNLVETPMTDGNIHYSWVVENIGDMSPFYGLTEIDGKDLHLSPDSSIALGENYTELVLLKDGKPSFKLSDYTHKIQS